MLDNNYDYDIGSVGTGKNTEFNTFPLEIIPTSASDNRGNDNLELDIKKIDGTTGTHGTASGDGSCSGSGINTSDGTGGIAIDLSLALNPLLEAADDKQIESLHFDQLDMPCFIVKEDWFYLGGKRKPGVWHCYETAGTEKKPAAEHAVFICSPLHIRGVTVTENSSCFGRLLYFRDTFGRWRLWAMPMELLRGSCEELRGELLAAGVEIDTRNRNQLANYLQWKVPNEVWTAATHTGWTANGKAFVLHDKILGDERVHFQSESLVADGVARVGGDYQQWQQTVAHCEDNPVLITSLSVAFSGPLLAKLHRDSGGIHWVGDSSTGKTTALIVGASVWGGDDFKRTWRATSNGLEGVAALLSDTCLCLDEISEAEPKEIGAIVYSLGNGTGKTRANRIGSARYVHRWRLSLISTGERTIASAMQEGGREAKSGQLVRLLNIPASRQFGVFDNLHDFSDGRAMSDFFKSQCAKHYGHAGVKFVEHIINLEKKGNADFGSLLAQYEQQFEHNDSQAARAASRFAVYALAGELAIEAGIVPWPKSTALNASKIMFDQWQLMRGDAATEHKQILQSIESYILKHSNTRFTDKSTNDAPKFERAGWFTSKNGERVYLFTPAALKEAVEGFDTKRILDALDVAGWLADRDKGERSKKTAIHGGNKVRLYWVLPKEEDHA